MTIVVIGASVGGVETILRLIGSLPAGLPASVFVVLHSGPQGPGLLPEIIRRNSALPVRHAVDGEKILRGHVYVSKPDYHLMLESSHIRAVRGPKENFHCPSIDALFRTAAECYGPSVVGVILTGNLDDGTAGLYDVKKAGGNLLRRLGEQKHRSETVGKNWGTKAKELEQQSALIRKLLNTFQRD